MKNKMQNSPKLYTYYLWYYTCAYILDKGWKSKLGVGVLPDQFRPSVTLQKLFIIAFLIM